MNRCNKCRWTKPVEEFCKAKKDGLQPWCKECRLEAREAIEIIQMQDSDTGWSGSGFKE
jgi:hypothetical protein